MDARSRSTPQDALQLARCTLLAGRRLDMQALAGELGVNRVTLYRWLGARDRILGEVWWSLAETTIWRLWEELADHPGPRVPEVLRRWLRATLAHPGVQHSLQDDGDLAMRLLTRRDGSFQPRLLALVRTLVAADVETGRVASSLDLDELASAVVRIAESYLYLPAITGEASDDVAIDRVLTALMVAGPSREPEPDMPG